MGAPVASRKVWVKHMLTNRYWASFLWLCTLHWESKLVLSRVMDDQNSCEALAWLRLSRRVGSRILPRPVSETARSP